MLRSHAFAPVVAVALALVACGGDDEASSAGTSSTSTGAGGAGTAGANGTGGTSGTGGAGGTSAAGCFDHIAIDLGYDAIKPVIGSHCKGTNHQAIEGVEKLVFLGDSITQGTFPTGQAEFYRTVLAKSLTEKFPGLEVAECAENGAKTDDLMAQLDQCFPGPEPKRTLVVMTMGGNDVAEWAKAKLPADQAIADAADVAGRMRAAVQRIKDPVGFPNGSFVIFADVYEYTDLTGDLDSCPLAGNFGFSGEYTDGAAALVHLEQEYMKVAVDTKTDVAFLFETFCGHGYHADDPDSPCYLGAGSKTWFDVSCIHPTPEGHGELAGLFQAVVDE